MLRNIGSEVNIGLPNGQSIADNITEKGNYVTLMNSGEYLATLEQVAEEIKKLKTAMLFKWI